MKPRDYKQYFIDILDSIEKIEMFIEGLSYDSFLNDVKTQFAVVRALEIIGEASNKIPADIKDKYPEIPWRVMIGMRHILIHDYFSVDIEVVWKTASIDIPPLKKKIIEIINTHK